MTGKRMRDFIAPFIPAAIMTAGIIAILFIKPESLPEEDTVITGDKDQKELETHVNYMLTDPARESEAQEGELSYDSEIYKSSQLEDIINFISENMKEE